ncbi:MAG: rhodanese-like domain-containing protein [Gammaproteobacteria bacterium]
MIEEVTPPEAAKLLENDNTVLLDVRSEMEYSYVGHPTGAIHIALQEPPDWQVDPAFVERVTVAIPDKDTTVLTLCRSGARSMLAAELLQSAGYSKAINIREGFEGDRDGQKQRGKVSGWRFHELPWEQS